MFDFLIGGARILTDDDVASAVLEYARLLAEHGRTDIVSFPAIVDGHPGETWMSLGAGLPVLAVRVETEVPVSLEGTDFAVRSIRRRTEALELTPA